MSGKSFVKGALILSLAGLFVKVLGAVYRIPFARIVGDEGMAIYQAPYSIYTIMLALSTAGIPLAISKMVAEREERQDYAGTRQILRVSLTLLFVIGLVLTVVLYGSAELLGNLSGQPKATLGFKLIAPAVLFTALIATFRGYFQGLQIMSPTAISQIIEQLVRVITIFVLAFFFLKYGIEYAAAGATFGAVTGGMAAFLWFLAVFFWYRKKHPDRISKDKSKESDGAILRQIIYLAIPISIGSLALPLMQVLDTFLVIPRLQVAGFSQDMAAAAFGQLSGKANTIINLPFIITTAIAASLVPSIAEAIEGGRKDDANKRFSSAILITLIIVLPATMGLMVLATPISDLLFATPEAGIPLAWVAPTVIAIGLYQIASGMQQGIGKVLAPVVCLLVGVTIKGILTYLLTAIPALGIRGAALGTVIGFSVAAILNIVLVSKRIGWEWLDYKMHIIKPLVAVVTMGILVRITFNLLTNGIISANLATLVSIAVGGVVYFVVLLAVGGIKASDIRKIPKVGDKLANLLAKFKLARD